MAAATALRARVSSIMAAAMKPASAAAAAAAAKAPDSVVLINCTMNNIHVCVSNLDGAVIAKCSGGVLGYKHRLRTSPLAAKEMGENVAKKAIDQGFRMAHVHMKGPSRNRSQVLRGILGAGLSVYDVKDVTPIPTNGCRPPHARRL